jgi:serine protease AprX
MAAITINGNLVEPAAQCEGGSQYEPNAVHSNYILLHVKEGLRPEQHAELEGLRVHLQQYTGANTYLCYFPGQDLDRIRELEYVEYANVYHPSLVIDDVLKSKCGINNTSSEQITLQDPASRETEGTPKNEVFDVDIMLHENPERSSDQIKQALVSKLHIDPATVEAGEGRLRVSTVDVGSLQQIAQFDEVKSVREVAYAVPHNHVARTDLDFVDYSILDKSITRADYDAEKIIVAVGDTGFDLGTLANQHPAFHNRVIDIINENPDHPTNDDRWGHGTHVSGSVACDHPSTQFGVIKGTAPAAEIVFQVMAYLTGKWASGDFRSGSLISPGPAFWKHAFDKSARIHNNSWGIGLQVDPTDPKKRIQNKYDDSPVAGDVDTFMRANEEFLVVFSAGNDGNEASITDTKATVGAQAAAKNALTVGACESSKTMDRAYHYQDKGSKTGNRDYIANFSSVGPTKNTLVGASNSRNKPDVVAPGTIIYSTRSRMSPLLWHYNPKDGSFKTPPDSDGQSTDPLFAFLSGTSMAAPLVTGCCAVLRKILLKRAGAGPAKPVTAALIKALIINGTVVITEDSPSRGPTVGTPPDKAQGHGRVSIKNSIRHVTDTVNCGIREGPKLSLGKVDTHPIIIPKAPGDNQKIVLKATMCYNDVGGSTDLVNVLSLKASQDQTKDGVVTNVVKYGNTNSPARDALNNVQKVTWDDIQPGNALLEVTCHELRNPAKATDQDYALVWSIDYVDKGVSAGDIVLYSLLGAAAVAIIAIVAVEASQHH